MTPQLRALIAMCAAAAMVCLVAVARWIETHGPGPGVESAVDLEAGASRDGAASADRARPARPQRVSEAGLASGAARVSYEPESAEPVGPNELAVVVLDRGTPAEGARIECHPLDPRAGGVDPREVGADGLARWEGLPPGNYELRLRLRSGAEATLQTEVFDGPGGSRAVARFGGATVQGTLFDLEGRPALGAPLRLLQTPRSGGPELVREVLTDSAGGFRFSSLAGGATRLVEARTDVSLATRPRQVEFELIEGERRRVDLGQADGVFTWRGQLRTSAGRPLDEPLVLRLREEQRGWTANITCAGDGSFSAQLRTGDWLATLVGYSGPLEVARVELRSSDLAQDAIVPGSCVRAYLKQEPSGGHGAAVGLRPADAEEGRDFVAHGRRVFVAGVPDGVWRIAARAAGTAVEPERELELALGAGTDLVELSLDVHEAPE